MGWSARSNTFVTPKPCDPKPLLCLVSPGKSNHSPKGGAQRPADKAKQGGAGSAFYAKALNFSNLEHVSAGLNREFPAIFK